MTMTEGAQWVKCPTATWTASLPYHPSPGATTLWVAGLAAEQPVAQWEIVGIFSTEGKAEEACLSNECREGETYFIAPLELDKAYPKEAKDWPGLRIVKNK